MAYLFQFQYSWERDLANLMLKVSIGATGAPTIVNGKGVSSIVRTGVGAYTITLKEPANILLNGSVISVSGASAPAAPSLNIVSETVNSSSSPQILIQLRNTAGLATDAANGEVLMFEFVMRNAST